MQPFPILIVEDESEYRNIYAKWLTRKGYTVYFAENAHQAEGVLARHEIGLVLLDLRLPPLMTSEVGLSLIPRILSHDPLIKIIVTSGSDTEKTAIKAIETGAYDFFEKSDSLSKLLIIIERAIKTHNLELRLYNRDGDADGLLHFDAIIGKSKKMQDIFALLKRISHTDLNVLLLGATGTGKDLIAQTIHFHSKRKNRPFVRVTPAAMPASLIETELFGYKKGAFTGADKDKIGRFQAADKGSLFLDEIGELPNALQVKLLRVIQEKSFEMIGDNRTTRVDVRIISATNRDLRALIQDGRFRRDLFYRLNTITIRLPDLRERKEDLPLLTEHFIKQYCETNGKRLKRVSQAAMDAMLHYDWPGNVRELKNTIERAIILSKGEIVGLDELPFSVIAKKTAVPSTGGSLRDKLHYYEKMLISEALAKSKYVQTHAADMLGISEKSLRDKMKKLHIPSARQRRST